MFLYSSNLSNVTSNTATLLSNYIRSSSRRADPHDCGTFPMRSGSRAADDNILAGDNSKASIISGVAWMDETYIAVRWGWISLPLGGTLLEILLLAATVVSARMSGVPVLGSSPLGLQFHGLGRERGEREKRVESRVAMVGVARGVEVRFQESGEGGLRFRVVEGRAEEWRVQGGRECRREGENGTYGDAERKGVDVDVIEMKS